MFDSTTPALSYATTVSRKLVHRAAICEVFLTDSKRRSDSEFWVAAQLPRVHSYYNDQASDPASYDPLLLLEVFRQTSILVTHAHLGVSEDRKFSFNTGDLVLRDPEALKVGPRPGHVLLEVALTAKKHRGEELVGITLEMRMSIDDRDAASMTMSIQWMPTEAWNKLRRRGRASIDLSPLQENSIDRRLRPSAVGRLSSQNVVLGEAVTIGREVTAQVAVDQSHPALFDHPLDHIPGALFFEAYRQTAIHAAHELLGLSPLRLSMTRCVVAFTRFGEFELPTTCSAELLEGRRDDAVVFQLEIRQGDAAISTAEMTLQCTSSTGRLVAPAPTAVQSH